MGSNHGEDKVVCKCIVTARHGGTLNSRRAASLLVRSIPHFIPFSQLMNKCFLWANICFRFVVERGIVSDVLKIGQDIEARYQLLGSRPDIQIGQDIKIRPVTAEAATGLNI
ncbi:hypothetical protein TNCV_3662281 [Trichonephila clavipes]|nr:hypothetical protein TNCV_3662281 [Trichonephila clavipes]